MNDDKKAKALLLNTNTLFKDDIFKIDIFKILDAKPIVMFDSFNTIYEFTVQAELNPCYGDEASFIDTILKAKQCKAFTADGILKTKPEQEYYIVDNLYLKKTSAFKAVVFGKTIINKIREQETVSLFDNNIVKYNTINKTEMGELKVVFQFDHGTSPDSMYLFLENR